MTHFPSAVKGEDIPQEMLLLAEIEGSSESISAHDPAEKARKKLLEDPSLPGILIFDQSELMGLLSRSTFFQLLSRNLGQELYGRRPISLMLEHANCDTTLLSGEVSVQDAIDKCLKRPREKAYEPVVVKYGGKFKIVGFNNLVMAQSGLLRKSMDKVTEQREQLAEKNKEIVDSIEYAERIQRAILKSQSEFRHEQVQSFVVFQPRDIVSGDFFWQGEANGKTIFAVVDCTGHGVPGAFMSLIGYSLLNEIVVASGISDPNLILERLHERVRETLHQDNTKNSDRDGMDVALCTIDPQTRKLQFSGAKRPLFYTNAEGELFTIKGDRFSIGGLQREAKRSFTRHDVDLSGGCNFFLTSDGFTDQPSVAGHKFGVKQLKQTLQEIHSQPFDQKKESIATKLADHRGNRGLRDDITLLGLSWRD